MDPLAAVSAVAAARAVAGSGTAPGQRAAGVTALLATTSTEPALSATAQLIESILTLPEGAGASAAASAALLPAPPGAEDTAALAALLRQSFGRSGLFYESHLAEWIQDRMPLEALLSEPQAAMLPLPPHGSAAGTPAELPRLAGSTATAPLDPTTGRILAADPKPASDWQGVVDPRATGIVQQQLLAADTQVMPWQGEPWPGQAAQLTIAPDPEGGSAQDGSVPQRWTSRLRLDLPQLGTIEAELSWSAQACRLQLDAPASALARLRPALPALAEALAAADIRPERIVIRPRRDSDHG